MAVMSAVKEVVRLTPEMAAHDNTPAGLSDEYIFFRMQQWIEDKTRGITTTHLMSRFKVFPTRALWLLHKFYFKHREYYDLKRGWYVEPPVREATDDKGDLIEYVGYIATEAQVEELEKNGEVVNKKLFSVHPPNLDTIEHMALFNYQRMDSQASRKPLSNLFDSEAAKIQREKESLKEKEDAKIQKLFEKEWARDKHADPTGKNKYKTPPKPKEDFFGPSPSRKEKDAKPSPMKGRRRMPFEDNPKNDLMMDDVFTTGDDDIEMEDIGSNTNELVNNKKPTKPAKIAASNYRPKRVSKEMAGLPAVDSDPIEEEDAEMEEDAPGPSTAPIRIKELRTVQETTRDDEGFLVTKTSKKMVETDKVVAPPPAKKKAPNPPVSKKTAKGAVPKQQSTLTDFFKRK